MSTIFNQPSPPEVESIPTMTAEVESLIAADRAAREESDALAFEVDRMARQERAREIFAERKRAAMADETAYAACAAEFASGVLSTDRLSEIEIPDPLIDGYLDRKSTARVFGPSGSMKSFAVLDMAACVAGGIDWHGHPTHAAKVLYVVAEGASGLLRRVRAWEAAYGLKMAVDFYPRAVQISDVQEMHRLMAFSKLGGYGFVIFDTQARCMVGVEENDNTRLGEMIAVLDILKEKTGACVMLVHHSGVEGGRARGGTSVLGALEGEFEVKRKSGTDSIEFITRKRKDGAPSTSLRLEAEERFVQTSRGTETSLAIKPGIAGVDSVTLAAMPKLNDNQKATLLQLSKYADASASMIAVDLGFTAKERNRADQYLKGLADKGLVVKTGQRWKITDKGHAALNVLGLRSQGRDEYLGDDED